MTGGGAGSERKSFRPTSGIEDSSAQSNNEPARRLSVAQRRALTELAAIRDSGSTGEAYWYPGGSDFKTAAVLVRHGFLRRTHGMRTYELTDAGYEAVRDA